MTTPNLILVLDVDRKAVIASDSYLQQSNIHSAEEMRDKTFDELFSPIMSKEFLSHMDDMIGDVLVNQNTIEVEHSIDFMQKGNNREYTINISPMLQENKIIMGVLLSFHDMTEIKQAQREAERARELAEHANKAKSSFLANMSHEIRTPMNAILGVTEIILQNESISEEVEEGLDKVYNSCNLLLGIINDILDFSKIEAGKLDIMTSLYKVAGLINDSAQLNMMRIGSKPIKFELQVDENIPARLIGDELRIKQILNNLLSNSFKYTSAGTVTLSVTSEKPVKQNSKKKSKKAESNNASEILVLSVRDTGHGMTKEQLLRLFDEYSRLNNCTDKYIEGTGLGLTITRRLIDLMNGEIDVESEPGVGSVFTVRLPQWKIDDEILGEEAALCLEQFRADNLTRKGCRKVLRDPMPYGKVLIVDDVETNLYVASGLMKPYRLQVDTAMGGREALQKIKEGNKYDVIFMDHMMPEIDGIETTNLLRDTGYTAPIIALTANAVTGQMDMFLSNGFDDFISKPIDIRRLDVVLNKFVRDKQPLEVLEAARVQKYDGNMNEASIAKNNAMLLESFVRDGRKALIVLDDLCQNDEFDLEENIQRFTVTVHGMKSSLLYIGESVLSETAKRLEAAGRDSDIDYITTHAPGFIEKLHALLDRIDPGQKEGNETGDIDGLHDTLRRLQNLCADYNRKGALELISAVKQCTKETRLVLDSINAYVVHSDFEEAETAVAEYISLLNISA